MDTIQQIDVILQVFNDHGVDYMLIGGVIPPRVQRMSACPMRICYNVNWRFIAWAASQSTAPKMTPAARKAKERRLLAGMAGMFDDKATEK